MTSRTTQRFRTALHSLPLEVRKAAREAYRRFRENPQHNSLRFKKVSESRPIYSVRITRDYRALGVRDDQTIVWFWIGSHADYDQLLSQLR